MSWSSPVSSRSWRARTGRDPAGRRAPEDLLDGQPGQRHADGPGQIGVRGKPACGPAVPARPVPARLALARPVPARPVPARLALARPVPARPVPARPVPARPVPARPAQARPVRLSQPWFGRSLVRASPGSASPGSASPAATMRPPVRSRTRTPSSAPGTSAPVAPVAPVAPALRHCSTMPPSTVRTWPVTNPASTSPITASRHPPGARPAAAGACARTRACISSRPPSTASRPAPVRPR